MARKQGISGFRPKLVSIAVASCFAAGTALANPTGPQVVNGQVSVLQNGNVLQITNSPNSIINWQTFSIGANEITRFIQQSQASAVLNRVTAGNPSQILGTLQSNGRVFLINPSGIVFGAGAQVDVAGLVASSLNLSNQDFLAGKLKFADAPGAGSVLNQGNITTGSGGQVYLVGPAVENKGIITSPNGEVVLAAGNSVELVSPGTPNLRVEITASDNEARNLGQIVVDSGRAGIYAGLITNSGTVRADSVVAEGGKILLKATKSVTLTDSSVLSAQGKGGGEIKVLATDNVRVAGTLDASAPTGGDGGFIETSAHHVSVADGVRVSTMAPFGKTGTYLIDPADFTIAASGGDMTGAAVASILSGSDFSLISDTGTVVPSGSGDINVNDGVSWAAATTFNLLARNNVNVNAPINNSGAGGVGIYAGWDGGPPTSPIAVTPGVGDININKNVMSGGQVILTAGRDINLVSPTNGINVKASDTLTVNAGGTLSITGSPGFSAILQSDGDQFITAGNLYMMGASSGSNGSAQIRLGTNCTPGVGCTPVPTSQTINIGGAAAPGMFELEGGGGSNNFAQIQSNGASQTINFTPGSDAEIVGGSGTNANFARIQAVTGTQTITGSPSLLLQGGSGGVLDDGNFAQIQALAGLQTIDAGNMQLFAGASGNSNFASIVAPSQDLAISGDLTLTGGGSTSGSFQGGGARIGGLGASATTAASATSLTLTVSGNVTLNGGSVANAGAAIGSNFQGGQTTDITMILPEGSVTLNPGSVSNGSARIGSPSASIGGGTISITAGGGVALNEDSEFGVGTFIRTTGNVSLNAGFGISEGTNSAIVAGGLEANGGNGSVSLTGLNMVSTLAGSARDTFDFVNGQNLAIGTVGSTSGITVNGTGYPVPPSINVQVTSGSLIVNNDVRASAGNNSGVAAAVTLQATNGAITVNGATVEALGGSGESGGAATVTLSAGTTVTLNTGAAVNAIGGGASCCGTAGDAKVTLAGAAGITVASGASVLAQGGNNSGSFGNTRGGNAQVDICAGTYGSFCSVSSGPITINGSVTANGGNGGFASFGSVNASGGNANISLSGGTITVNGSVTAKGGDGGFASNSGAVNASGGNANISLSGGTITVGSTGSLTASGGRGGSASAFAFEGSNAFATASGGNASVSLSASGDISVAGSIVAKGGNGGSESGAFAVGNGVIQANASGGAANVFVNTSGGITVSGPIQATGGNAGNAYASGSQAYATANGGNAFVNLTGGTGANGKSVVVNGAVSATAGNGGNAFGSGFFIASAAAAGGGASVSLRSTTGAAVEGGGITVNGGNGGFAGFSLGSGSGAFGFHSADGGSALVSFNTVGGAVAVNNSVLATGGNGGSGGPRNGGSASIVIAPQVSCDGPCPFPVVPGDVTVSADVIATGGTGANGGNGGNAQVIVASNNFTLNVAEVEAYAGANGAATTSISALGSIALNGGNVEANVGCTFPCNGDALVSISAGGNVDLGSTNVSAFGENSGQINIGTPAGYIHNGAGTLSANDNAGGVNSSIGLTARDGIGTTANPIRFGGANVDLQAVNSGSTGDIAVALTSGDITIDDLGNFVNANPNGIYFIRADSGNINLNTPFMPFVQSNACDGPCFTPTPLQAGQSVELHSPLGSIAIAPGAGIDGAAKVVLEAKTNLQLGSGSTVSSSSDVLLKSNAMDLQGTVTAANNIYVTPFDNGTAIDLGNPGAPGGVLALDGGELGRLTALGVGIGSDGVATSGSAITISGPVGPFSAFPNLFGTTITESGGSINSPGGINIVASGNVSLTGPNDIGAFSALSTGGGITLVNVGNLGLGAVNATGTVNLSSGGIIFNLGSPGAGTITAPSVVLAAANGIGQSSLPIFVPNATSVSATNTTSGDIVLSQPTGNFTIGAGGWQLSNTGGDYIIGGNTVTLNGGPSTGNMFVTSGSDVNVGPSGYSNSGTVVLQALNNVNVSGNLTANDVALFADNQVNINGATVTGNNTASVSATQLNITAGSAPAQLKAGSILGVAAGEINLTGGSGTNAFAEMSVGPAGEMDVFTLVSPVTTGNINLKGGAGSGAYARIFGDPDVGSLLLPLSVDGVINMTSGAGSGAYARIESASVNSIHVDFVNVPSGGFFVNGTEGTISSGQSGFFAGGQPAVPEQNLFVSYGGMEGSFVPSQVPQDVLTAINQVIATTQPLPTDGSSNGTSGGDTADETKVAGGQDEKQKKQLPICGK